MHGQGQRSSRIVRSPGSCLRFFRLRFRRSGDGSGSGASLSGGGGCLLAVLRDVAWFSTEHAELVVEATLPFLRGEFSVFSDLSAQEVDEEFPELFDKLFDKELDKEPEPEGLGAELYCLPWFLFEPLPWLFEPEWFAGVPEVLPDGADLGGLCAGGGFRAFSRWISLWRSQCRMSASCAAVMSSSSVLVFSRKTRWFLIREASPRWNW